MNKFRLEIQWLIREYITGFPEYMKDLLDNIKNLIEVENEG